MEANKLASIESLTLSITQQSQLRKTLEQGLPKVSRPYALLAQQINASEQQIIDQITQWQHSGLIRRFGLVVKHRQLGFTANAMVVWNVPDELVDSIAEQLANFSEVSLCYRRPRRLPTWRYNLFCMIHGTCRNIVLAQIDKITKQLQRDNSALVIDQNVLFSNKAYKQNGARYSKQQPLVKKKEIAHG